MAKSNPAFLKRQRERKKEEQRKQKALRKQERKQAQDERKASGDEEVDDDIAGIVPGPQALPWEFLEKSAAKSAEVSEGEDAKTLPKAE